MTLMPISRYGILCYNSFMTDRLSLEKRSWNMSRIGSKNTGPEKATRLLLRKHGYKFILHQANLPGKPDIVMPRHKLAIFVNGCFWHSHKGCKDAGIPKSNIAFWKKKLSSNVIRDKKNGLAIRQLGWRVFVIWECEVSKPKRLINRLRKFLKSKQHIYRVLE